MGVGVLILGHSGSGKSTSLRNMPPEQVGVFNVASKPLPFKAKFPNIVNHATYDVIKASLAKNGLKRYVIDDANYLMSFELFSRAKEVGYGKFTDIAVRYASLLDVIREHTSDDTIVYVMSHIDTGDDGRVQVKSVGKMLQNQLCIEGLFSIVLMCETDGKNHYFVTQSDGYTPAKTPMGMFSEVKVDNDLAMVDKAIREYYGFDNKEGEKKK